MKSLRTHRLSWGWLLVLAMSLCALTTTMSQAQSSGVPSQQSIAKTLSLRIKPRTITFERPIAGDPIKINNGATVLIQDGAIRGVLNPEKGSSPIKLTPSVPITGDLERRQKPIPAIEMRVLGQSIYLDRQVELFVVQDITGRSIKTLVKGHKMTLEDLRPGVYIVRVQDKGIAHTSKFILR